MLTSFLFLYSPLEQFEISAYNTSLNYITSYSMELLEKDFFLNYNPISFYNLFDILFIFLIIRTFQLYIKNDGFLFLYIFISVILTCINIYSFTDFVIYQGTPNLLNDALFYITINSSFINMYSVFFCFVFIFLIVYLIFNKAISNNTNTIIPNIYQMFGETIYKVSLNLFYSVLGKHLTHPEFFIKINTIFLFLIISNVQGMIPYMSTLTSALSNTFFIALALFISIIITLLDKKGINYFLNLFMPSGCPIFLVLLLIPIEIISYSFRVVSLSVRLFANMMAGHTLLKVIVGFS